MKVVRIALGVVAVVLALCSATASEAATRARFRAETVLNDPSARISAGFAHTCQVNEDGSVRCWGLNTVGQLGNGTRTDERSTVPVLVTGLPTAVAVTAGGNFSCALLFDGSVRCWGINDRGQLGNGAGPGLSLVPVAVTGITTAVAISAGTHNTCALLANGTVRCWGTAVTGDGNFGDRLTPVTILASPSSPLTNVVAIAVGSFHACALTGAGEMRCWGENFFGQLGRGSVGGTFSTPGAVLASPGTRLANVVAITAGNGTTCAQLTNGSARCWGNNNTGQFGVGTTPQQSATPLSVSGAGFTGIATGGRHTCLLGAGGSVRCSGNNDRGQIGDGTRTTRHIPVFAGITPIPQSLLNVVAVTTGNAHTCALLADGSAKCWGDNQFGQLGISNTALLNTSPTPVLGGGGTFTARDIAAGSNHTCAVRANGAVVCWGSNGSGQLGVALGDTNNRLVPTAVAPPPAGEGPPGPAVAVAAGDAHTCALVANGTVRCWGENGSGQLGLGDNVDRTIPVTVPGLLSVVGIAAGGALGSAHTCALHADGTVHCWGSNGSGQLGTGNTAPSTVPVAVPGLANVVAIAAGELHTCALTASGFSFCWGFNGSGRLGEGTQTTSLRPIIVGLANLVSIAGASSHTCALRSDGTSWCWGANASAQLGIGSIGGFRAVPTHVNLSNAIAIAGGLGHSCALVSAGGDILSGEARCWGDNSVGQLGNASTTSSLVPEVVKNVRTIGGLGGSFTVATPLRRTVGIATGRRHSCVLLATGGVSCWGDNSSGQIGVNSTTNFFSQPSAVPSFTLNINTGVSLDHRDRVSTVTVIANCDAGRQLHVLVTLTQDTAVGHGIGAGKCTGAMERYPVTVPVWGRGIFIDGAGQVSAEAAIRERGLIVDKQQWTRAVQVERAP